MLGFDGTKCKADGDWDALSFNDHSAPDLWKRAGTGIPSSWSSIEEGWERNAVHPRSFSAFKKEAVRDIGGIRPLSFLHAAIPSRSLSRLHPFPSPNTIQEDFILSSFLRIPEAFNLLHILSLNHKSLLCCNSSFSIPSTQPPPIHYYPAPKPPTIPLHHRHLVPVLVAREYQHRCWREIFSWKTRYLRFLENL